MDEFSQDEPEERMTRFRELFREWREVATTASEEMEEFARRKPGTALAGAFVAGLLVSRLFGRKG